MHSPEIRGLLSERSPILNQARATIDFQASEEFRLTRLEKLLRFEYQ
jgi:hypothetical protein